MNTIRYIYTLSDPITDEIKYVGATKDIKKRLKQHLKDKRRAVFILWIKTLRHSGYAPVHHIIDEVSEDDWQFWEQHYISLYKSWGFNLINIALGGIGPTGVSRKQTEETKRKLSTILHGRKFSPETMKKIRESGVYERHTKRINEFNRNKIKSVIQYSKRGEFIKEWVCVQDAENELGIFKENIRSVANNYNHHKTAGGFIWKYKN